MVSVFAPSILNRMFVKHLKKKKRKKNSICVVADFFVGEMQKPSYNSAYGSSGYDALGQSAQDYNKTAYPGSGSQPSKGQNSNPPPTGTGSDISSSMYGNKNHAALNKVNVSVDFTIRSHPFGHFN